MIEFLSEKLALSIKRANEHETVSVAVMKYALISIINTMLTLVLALAIGLVFGKFWETGLAFLAFGFLRFFSGGYHLKNSLACIFISTLVVAGIPHIPLSNEACLIATAASCLLILIFAPANLQGHTKIPNKYFPYMKLTSLLIAGSNFLFVSPILAAAFCLQSITLLKD